MNEKREKPSFLMTPAMSLPLPWPLGSGAPKGAVETIEAVLQRRPPIPAVWKTAFAQALITGWTPEAVEALAFLAGDARPPRAKSRWGRNEWCGEVLARLAERARSVGDSAREFVLLVGVWKVIPVKRTGRQPWARRRARLLTLTAMRLARGKAAWSAEEYDALGALFAALLEGLFKKLYLRYGKVGGREIPWDDFRHTLLITALRQVPRFDPARGTEFSTLVTPHLTVAAQRDARAAELGVKPAHAGEASRRMWHANKDGTPPDEFTRRVLFSGPSLDEPKGGDDDRPLGEFIADTRAASAVSAMDTWLALEQAVHVLERQGKKVSPGFLDRLRAVFEGRAKALLSTDIPLAQEVLREIGLAM